MLYPVVVDGVLIAGRVWDPPRCCLPATEVIIP